MSFRTSSDKLTYISKDVFFEVPEKSRQIFISMVGGGGAGGQASETSTGGGGGAGGACSRMPFFNEGYVAFDCIVGKGGDEKNPDGGDTIVDVYVDKILTAVYKVKGGKGADGKKGGAGGKGYYTFHGLNGSDGVDVEAPVSQLKRDTSSTTNFLKEGENRVGGEGGASIHFSGGNNDEINGSYGSGGAGGTFKGSVVGKGGDGFIVIEYI